jgi:hypothetical protein
MSWNSIIEAASGSGKKLSRGTLSKLAKRLRQAHKWLCISDSTETVRLR